MLMISIHQFTRHAVKWVKRIPPGPALTVFTTWSSKNANWPSGNAARENLALKVRKCPIDLKEMLPYLKFFFLMYKIAFKFSRKTK